MKTWEEERTDLIRCLVDRLYALDHISNQSGDLATEMNAEVAKSEMKICETYLQHLGLMDGDQWTEKGDEWLENVDLNTSGAFT